MSVRLESIDRLVVAKGLEDYDKNFAIMADMYKNYIDELMIYTEHPLGGVLREPADADNYVLITYKDKPVGFVIYSVFPEALTRHDVFIEEFYVRHDKRRKGIGKAFVKLMIKAAEYQNMDISLSILDKNETAKRFWDRTFGMNGYMECFIRQNIHAHDGDRTDLRWHYWTKSVII